MRRPRIVPACALVAWALRAGAGESAWRTMPLPPEAGRLVRLAEATDSSRAAARFYAEAIRLCPSNGPALYGLGRLMLGQDRPADALKIFRRLDALFPGDAGIHAGLAAALARLPDLRRSEVQEGLALAERAAQAQPGSPEAWHLLSILLHLDGDYARAADAARQAVQLEAHHPSDPEAAAAYQQQETACNDALSVFSPLD